MSKTFADRLVFARTHFGTMQIVLTQQELSKLCGISAMHISHFEGGKRQPSVKNLIKLAKALGVTTDWILGL